MRVPHSFFWFFFFPNLPMSKLKTMKVITSLWIPTLFVNNSTDRFDLIPKHPSFVWYLESFFMPWLLQLFSIYSSLILRLIHTQSSALLSNFILFLYLAIISLHNCVWFCDRSSFDSTSFPHLFFIRSVAMLTFDPYFLLYLNHHYSVPSLSPLDQSFNPNYFLH